jgi:hypothetical protein
MSKVFYRKKFSDYLGEQRAIDDIVQFFTSDIPPTPSPTPVPPTPTPTLTKTPTPTPLPVSPTPTATPTNTPSGTPQVTPTNTPSSTPQPTTTPTPSSSPISVSPTPTLTKTPTPTPGGPSTAGIVTGDLCGDDIISGGTFSITYNGNTYPVNTVYTGQTLTTNIPIQYPAPGVIYDFQFNNDSGYTLCNIGLGGQYDRIKITVGSSVGTLLWSSRTELMSGSTVTYVDNGDNVSMQSSPYSAFGQTFTVSITNNLFNSALFAVRPTINPPAIPNLTGWWKSDTNVVTDVDGVLTWTDIISGNTATRSGGNNFNNNTSLLNGYYGITQSGGANEMNLSTTYSLSACTIFLVFNSVPDGIIMYWGGVSNGGFFTNYSALPGLGIYNNPDIANGGSNISTPQYGTYYMDNANYVIRQNGTVVNTTAIGSGGNIDLGILFRGNTGGGYFGLNGSMWELMIYDRALSNPEIIQVQNYLSTKYGL